MKTLEKWLAQLAKYCKAPGYSEAAKNHPFFKKIRATAGNPWNNVSIIWFQNFSIA